MPVVKALQNILVKNRHSLLGVSLALPLASALAWWYVTHDTALTPQPSGLGIAAFVNEGQCQGCHTTQFQAWQGSHHQQAMQLATPSSVLGDFNNAGFTSTDTGEHTRFYRKGEQFWVNANGADGAPADFQVRFTFGVAPLQQYLLEYPGGRLQALGIAWDTQARRWFSLHPGQGVDHRSDQHWTRPAYNANFMCIECHATNFKRHFDPSTDTFASRWTAPGVGCQACHGPASAHVQWAGGGGGGAGKGFAVPLKGSQQHVLVEACARCHARRAPLADGFDHRHRLMDDYLPSSLTSFLHELDGKAREETFEYSTFAQSRMYAKGVTCTDCHDPHSGKPVAEGNGLCLQCHNPAARPSRPAIDGAGLQAKVYDSPEHHRHTPGSAGAQCVACHMPGKFYMGNDYRHDHGFSLPDPHGALRLGTPDACLSCHADQPAQRIVDQFSQWFGTAQKPDGYASVLATVRGGGPGAARALQRLLARGDLPPIRHATLLAELPGYPGARSLALAVEGLTNAEPQVRGAAVEAVAGLAGAQQLPKLLAARLSDPVRAVRTAAAWRLAQAGASGARSQPLAAALEEYRQVQLTLAERPEANLNLAMLYQVSGRHALVEPALRAALLRDPDYLPAVVALAQWLDRQGQREQAREVLQNAVLRRPKAALLQHALGLAAVRAGGKAKALQHLHQAARLEPENPQYGFVFAVALHDAGQSAAALQVLGTVIERQPANRQARLALVGYLRRAGAADRAQALLEALARINPDDPALQVAGRDRRGG